MHYRSAQGANWTDPQQAGEPELRYELDLVTDASMPLPTLLAFAAAFFVFAASPGPDNVTIVARTLAQGPAAGFAYGAGTVAGILIFLMLAAFGLSLLASEMGLLMSVLRYGGAAYLVYMGVKLWTAAPVPPDATLTRRQGLGAGFLTGIALNLGNPKMPLFYVALLPNVVHAELTGRTVAALALVIILVEIVVVGGHVLAAHRARRALSDPRTIRRVNRVAGATLIGGAAVVATR